MKGSCICLTLKQVTVNAFFLPLQKIVKEIESMETDNNDRPKKQVVITDSGVEDGFKSPYEVPKTGVFV